MATIETDYLVIGAGASGMAFVDTLIDHADVEVVIVDRRHRPGGHWVDAYPFVRLHQPSAFYGVESRPLGDDRIDAAGPNAGFYERASAAEMVDYYGRTLDERFVPTNKVSFLGMTDYVGADGDEHRLVSRVSGQTTTVRVRRKLVDASYLEATVPSTHPPQYEVGAGVRLLPPNDLVGMVDAPSGFTVIGAGKTAMDTCCFLLEHGVDPGRIRWVRPRDAWFSDRAAVQPLTKMASAVAWLAGQVEGAAEAEHLDELFYRWEDKGVVRRLDPAVPASFFRGAFLSEYEWRLLGQIEDVVRLGRVQRITESDIELDRGSLPHIAGHVVVDCTAAALAPRGARPIFEPGRVTMQWLQFGIVPFSAAFLGLVEATRDDDAEKNRLCRPNPIEPDAGPRSAATGVQINWLNRVAWTPEPDLDRWLNATRLGPLRGIGAFIGDDPAIGTELGRLLTNVGPALANLERLLGPDATPGAAA